MFFFGFIFYIFLNILIYFLSWQSVIVSERVVRFEYHDYESLQNVIAELHENKCAGISRIYSIGKSVEDRDLTVLLISANIDSKEFFPDFFYAGNIHGNEPVSKEVFLALAEDLCFDYKRNITLAKQLLNNIRIHLLFSLNPDGYEKSTQECRSMTGRYNANGVDLNRNFKYLSMETKDAIQPETKAAIKWVSENYFILSAVGHGGALVVSYPLDGDASMKTEFLPSKDQNYIVRISKQFAGIEGDAFTHGCKPIFYDGVTNGAEWYPLINSFQDYIYFETSGIQLTIEMSCCKFPPSKDLQGLYLQHKEALMILILQTLTGVKGRIRYKNGKPINAATISFSNGGKDIKTTKDGYFMKNMLPGEHSLVVKTLSTNGHLITSEHNFIIITEYRTVELNIFID